MPAVPRGVDKCNSSRKCTRLFERRTLESVQSACILRNSKRTGDLARPRLFVLLGNEGVQQHAVARGGRQSCNLGVRHLIRCVQARILGIGLAATVRRLVRERAFELIFVHCSSVSQYVEDVQGVPKILDFGDMDSQKWL